MKTFKQFKAELNEVKELKFDYAALVSDLEDPMEGFYPEIGTAKKVGSVKAYTTSLALKTSKGVVPALRKFENATRVSTVLVNAGDTVVFNEDGDGPFGDKVIGYIPASNLFWMADLNEFVRKIGFK